MIVNRRTLVAGLAGAAALPMMPGQLLAQEAPRLVTVSKRTLDVKGKAATVYGLTGPDGKPGLDMLLGEPFRVKLFNDTDTETLIHWHGLTPPSAQDGVPMISQDPIGPGQSYDYDFVNTTVRHPLDAFACGLAGTAVAGGPADRARDEGAAVRRAGACRAAA